MASWSMSIRNLKEIGHFIYGQKVIANNPSVKKDEIKAKMKRLNISTADFFNLCDERGVELKSAKYYTAMSKYYRKLA